MCVCVCVSFSRNWKSGPQNGFGFPWLSRKTRTPHKRTHTQHTTTPTKTTNTRTATKTPPPVKYVYIYIYINFGRPNQRHRWIDQKQRPRATSHWIDRINEGEGSEWHHHAAQRLPQWELPHGPGGSSRRCACACLCV